VKGTKAAYAMNNFASPALQMYPNQRMIAMAMDIKRLMLNCMKYFLGIRSVGSNRAITM